LVPWLASLAASRAYGSPGWRGPEAFPCVFTVEDVEAIATLLR
jgi:hypothetical protein